MAELEITSTLEPISSSALIASPPGTVFPNRLNVSLADVIVPFPVTSNEPLFILNNGSTVSVSLVISLPFKSIVTSTPFVTFNVPENSTSFFNVQVFPVLETQLVRLS